MLSGIYAYLDNKTGKIVYIGKDKYIEKHQRYKSHLHPSKYDIQPFNRVLQNNPDRYEYEVLKVGEFNDNLLSALEIIYIKRYGTYDNRKGYGESYGFNFTVGGDGLKGFKHSEKTKQKLREINTGKKHSKETKKKLSELNKGKNAYWYGKNLPNKTKRKISNTLKGRKASPEARRNISNALKGRKFSEEHKKKISEANKGKIMLEESRQKMSESHKNKKLSEEHKRKISESCKKKYARITKQGKYNGKQNYGIRMNGKVIKSSIKPSKLLKWFTKEYPTTILKLNF